MKLMKQGQERVKHRGDIGQPGLDVGFKALSNLFEMTDDGEQGEGGLDHHAVIVGTLWAQDQVVRYTVGITEAQISEDQRLLAQASSQAIEGFIWHVQSRPSPVDDS